jgi:hypothetical protein
VKPLAVLLTVVLALTTRPARELPDLLAVHDLAPLTDAQARQLADQPALWRVVIDSETDGSEEHGWWYECRGEGEPLRTLVLPDGDDLAAHAAVKRSGLLLVEATLGRIVHPARRGPTGRACPSWWSTGWCAAAWWTGRSCDGGGPATTT